MFGDVTLRQEQQGGGRLPISQYGHEVYVLGAAVLRPAFSLLRGIPIVGMKQDG